MVILGLAFGKDSYSSLLAPLPWPGSWSWVTMPCFGRKRKSCQGQQTGLQPDMLKACAVGKSPGFLDASDYTLHLLSVYTQLWCSCHDCQGGGKILLTDALKKIMKRISRQVF